MTDVQRGFVELRGHTYFSLLQASASPEAMVARAKEIGMSALGITDCDSLAGAMRFWAAAKSAGIKPIFGAEVTLADGGALALLAETQAGYANLCRLITRARCDAARTSDDWLGKVAPAVTWEMLHEQHDGLIALTGWRTGPASLRQAQGALLAHQPERDRQHLQSLVECFGAQNVFVELQHHAVPGDDALVRDLVALAKEMHVPLVTAGGSTYATREQAQLCDCLIAIDHNLSLTEARRAGLLPHNHRYAIPTADEMARRFVDLPEALHNTQTIAERCNVSLDFSRHRLPAFPVPDGRSEFRFLYDLCHAALPERYPDLRPQVLLQMTHELAVIERAGLQSFFLIVWDFVRFAREHGIRCQGRGSAAGSIVAYLLGISAVDPIANNLLFERFLSDNKFTMPDIDVDFAHDGREALFTYAAQRYGPAHIAMVCNHVTYQAPSALRDLGKALGFPEQVIARLGKQIDAFEPAQAAEQLEQLASDQGNSTSSSVHHPIHQLAALMRQIDGCVRHLSIHVGGLVITGAPLDGIVPIEPATMPNRFVVQWDKDDIEDAGLIKFDALSLRTLGMITEAVKLIAHTEKQRKEEETQASASPFHCVQDPWPATYDDQRIYDMLWKADTIGLFQVESPAQQQYLPRTRPSNIQELGHEIAIIRPGPVQANAVHPYIRRRAGLEPVTYPHPLLEPVLKSTLGVLLYQEQVMQIAMVIARSSAAEADQLRRAMSRHRSRDAMTAMLGRFIAGAQTNGIERTMAESIFNLLLGFASYGFCRSHAASFAQISYVTAWLKLYHPTEFACAILNSQPMGFYPSEVIVNDAKRHGVLFLPPDINASAWQHCIEAGAIRIGLSRVKGMGERAWQAIAAARNERAFNSLTDFCRRVDALPKALVLDLIRAGLFDSLNRRREGLWQELSTIHFASAMLPLDEPASEVALPELSALEASAWDYALTGLSTSGQFMRFHRAALTMAGALTAEQVKQQPAGRRVRVAGMVISRQRPQTARGTVYITMEDETALLQIVVAPNTYERYKAVIRSEGFLLFDGVVQKAGESVNMKAMFLSCFHI
jgi:error-prone DNA polymerase